MWPNWVHQVFMVIAVAITLVLWPRYFGPFKDLKHLVEPLSEAAAYAFCFASMWGLAFSCIWLPAVILSRLMGWH